MGHPRAIARLRPVPPAAERVRVFVYVGDDTRREWVESELKSTSVVVQTGRSLEDLVCALVEDPPPRPQVLVADFESMSRDELDKVAQIRQLGWFGMVFTVGRTSMAIRNTLHIERVFPTPLQRNALKAAIAGVSHEAQTLRIARIMG